MKDTEFVLKNLSALRIYLLQSQIIPADSFWGKIFPQNVSTAIMKAAKNDGISLAILYPVKAGFLQGSDLVFDHSEVPPLRLPVCIELSDSSEQLQQFVHNHQNLLIHARTIFVNANTYELLRKN